MNDQIFSLSDFQNWLESYNQQKKNQQSFGIQNIPARVFRKTIDMTTAASIPISTGVPFNGIHVEKIYDATTGLSVDGNIKLNFDRAMIDIDSTYKRLVENDCFTLGFSTANAFLSWTAQANVKVDICFFNDIDYKSGSQKTTISGVISVANSSANALYAKSVIPVITVASLSNTTNNNVRTIPVGKYAWVTIQCSSGGAVGCSANISGTKIIDCSSYASTQVANSIRICVPAGTVFGMTSNSAGAIVSFVFEEYDVI